MKRLLELRKLNGLSREKLGEIVHLSGSTIASYEQGRRFPDVNAIKKIADYFDVSLDYLYERTDNPCSINNIDRDLSVMNLFYQIPKEEQELFIRLMQIAANENALKLKIKKEKTPG